MNSSYEDSEHDYMQNPLLRREASGEDLHKRGPIPDILSAIALREYLLDQAVNERASINEEDNPLIQSYKKQVERVNQLKEEYGIGDPPPLDRSKK